MRLRNTVLLVRWPAGAGSGAMLATPGPGSILFQNTKPWYLRLGGGVGVGSAVGIFCFAVSSHPSCEPYLKYLPTTMQPEVRRPSGEECE